MTNNAAEITGAQLDAALHRAMTGSFPAGYLAAVHRFNEDLIGLPIPEQPTRLSEARKEWAATALSEEIHEFITAENLADEADALVDLTYFALGRLVEMGIVPGPVFEEVHARNMAKRRGTLSKRPNSLGYDAIKPEGWTAPDIEKFLAVTSIDVQNLFERQKAGTLALAEEATAEALSSLGIKPKVLILGHARHGKDTVAEILRDQYGLSFVSSSQFCAEHVVWPLVMDHEKAYGHHVAAGSPGMSVDKLMEELVMMQPLYANAEDCFKDRGNFRHVWYSLIAAYCWPDKARLAREIFAENDIYVGIRNSREFHAVYNAGLADVVIWVDASERKEPESAASCTVEAWMAQFVIDNNGTLEELATNVHSLMAALGFSPIS